MIRRLGGIAVVVAWVVGCSSSPEEAPAPGPVTSAQLENTWESPPLPPGGEDPGLCASWTLNNDEPVYVQAVELVTEAGGYHHSNWFFVPEAHMDGPDGIWKCDERGYNEGVAAALGGVLFAQSTQSTHETQQFPERVALPLPARARIVGNLHLLNTTGVEVTPKLTLGLHTVPESEVDTKLAAMSFTNEALAIPPASRSEFGSSCDLGVMHEEQLGRAMDFNLYYVLPHYHTLGTGMRVEAFTRDEEGVESTEVIFDGDSPVGHALGRLLEEPFSMVGFDGLRFTCRFDNPRNDTVVWGSGDQEMCVMLAFTDSEQLWGGGAFGVAGEPAMEDGVARFDADCGVLTYPASHAR